MMACVPLVPPVCHPYRLCATPPHSHTIATPVRTRRAWGAWLLYVVFRVAVKLGASILNGATGTGRVG